MGLRDDRRGQAIQIGAVLLFAILIIAFSTYQAVIVPADNRRVEFNHNQEVQSQLADLRNAVLGAAEAEGSRSVSVDLGTQYPSRTLGLNPPPASGTLRTVGTTDSAYNVTIHNASADGETGDFWNGSAVTYDTGALQYAPTYSRYNEAPTTVYEHSVLFNQFTENRLVLANQTMVADDRLSIVALNGSLSRSSSRSTTVDVRPVSSGGDGVLVEPQNPSSPITVEFASTLSESEWRRILSDEDAVTSVDASTSALGSDHSTISVTLASGQSYRLSMAKAAVGTGATDTDPAYLTDVAGDGESVQQGGSQQLTLAVRDRYNNPVAGVSVNASAGGTAGASLDDTQKTTGADGRVTFTYQPGSSTPTGEQDVNFTTGDAPTLSGSSFDPETAKNVTMTVAVTGSGGGGTTGAYTVDWTDPLGETTNAGDAFAGCDNETCTWDVGASDDDRLDLNATLEPVFEGVGIEFAVSNSTVGTVSPGSAATDADGSAITTLTAAENGTIDLLASANEDSDTITVEVTNVTDGSGSVGPTIDTRVDDMTRQNANDPAFIASYELSNVNSSFERVEVSLTPQNDATSPVSRSSTDGGVRFDLGYGSGNSFDITYDVIYTDSTGAEYVAASTTVTDTADAENPGSNVELSSGLGAQLTSWTIEDRTNTNNNTPWYRYTYDVDGTGSFNEVRLYALNQPGNGGSNVTALTTRGENNQDIQPSFGANQEYRVGILVRNANGTVVDVVSRSDVADGAGTYNGP